MILLQIQNLGDKFTNNNELIDIAKTFGLPNNEYNRGGIVEEISANDINNPLLKLHTKTGVSNHTDSAVLPSPHEYLMFYLDKAHFGCGLSLIHVDTLLSHIRGDYKELYNVLLDHTFIFEDSVSSTESTIISKTTTDGFMVRYRKDKIRL